MTYRRCDLDLATGLNDGTSWANAYQTIDAAWQGSSAGDVIGVSHTSSQTSTGTLNLGTTNIAAAITNQVWFVSVNKSTDAPTAGASVSADSIQFSNGTTDGGMGWHGMTFTAADQGSTGSITVGSDAPMQFWSCTAGLGASSSSSSTIKIASELGSVIYDQTIDFNASGASTGGVGASSIGVTYGVTWTGDTGLADVRIGSDDDGGAGPEQMDGVDLSNLTAATTDALYGMRNSAVSQAQLRWSNVLLPTGTFNWPVSYAVAQPYAYYTLSNASNSTDLHGLQHVNRGGTVVDNTSKYLTADVNGTGFSLQYDSTANTTHTSLCGHNLNLCEFWADANKTLTINFMTEDTLDKGNVWLMVGYPDATNPCLRKWTTTRDIVGLDSTLGTVGTLATGSSSWTEDDTPLTSPNYYELSVSLTSSAGPHVIELWIAKPSVTVYVDPEPEIA